MGWMDVGMKKHVKGGLLTPCRSPPFLLRGGGECWTVARGKSSPGLKRWGRRQRQIKEGLCCPDLLRPTPPTPPDRVRLPEGRRGIWGGGVGGEAADTETSEGWG